MKKRYIVYVMLLVLLLISLNVARLGPVRPFIQLPGELYPGLSIPILGGLTNTFMATVLAYIILFLLPVLVKPKSHTADEVPTGFYNFFEMVVEGGYNFVKGITGDKAKDFFPLFMTFFLLVLVVNLLGLVPGFDSIGLWEYKPHFTVEKDVKSIISEAESAFAAYEEDAEAADRPLNEYIADALTIPAFAEKALETTNEEELLKIVEKDFFAAQIPAEEWEHYLEEHDVDTLTLEEVEEEFVHVRAAEYDLENLGAISTTQGEGPGFLLRAETNEDGEKEENADWTIVPFFRPGATDLNFTLAIALVSMTIVQYFGFKYLGLSYLTKFFVYPRGFVDTFVKDPMQGIILLINPVVGLIELVSEISKVISFSFRLLGAMFGGMVLLFVMGGLLPLANIAFYGLELFVGAVQALVFAVLSIIFMSGATESHHGDEHH